MNFAKIKADLTKVYDELAKYWGEDERLHDWGEKELKEFAALVFKDKPGLYGDFQARLGKIGKDIRPRVLKSIHKIVKKGGILYLVVKKGEGEGEVEDERNGKKVRRFFSFFKKSELIAFLEEASFKILKVSRFKRTKTSTYWLQVFACKI